MREAPSSAHLRRAAGLLLLTAAVLALPLIFLRTREASLPISTVESAGMRVFQEQQCGHCHRVAGVPGARGTVGIPLDGVALRAGSRVPGVAARDYLERKILHPETYRNPDYLQAMPAFEGKLSDQDLDNLVSWLMTLKTPPDRSAPDSSNPDDKR